MFLKTVTTKLTPLVHPMRARVQQIATTANVQKIYNVQSVEDFDERVKNSKTPVVVDFFATWCNPCKMLTPRIETVIQEADGKFDLAKVDIDEHSDLALDYNVSSVPVLVILQDGKEVKRMVGLQDADKLRHWVLNSVK